MNATGRPDVGVPVQMVSGCEGQAMTELDNGGAG